MAYSMVYLRVRRSGYSFGWTSDTEQAAFKEETRRIFQESGWTLKPGSNGVCDTVTSGHQDLYLHPLSFSGVMDEANIQTLQEQLSKAKTFQCYHLDCYEEYLDMSDEEYHAALEEKRGEMPDVRSWKMPSSKGSGRRRNRSWSRLKKIVPRRGDSPDRETVSTAVRTPR